MTFEEFSLDPCILAGVDSAGFTTPTPIQEQAIPVVLQEKDLLGLAQTGTGKTAAFLLPIFQRLIQQPTRKVRVLILAPTRELAEQIHQASVDLGRHTGVKSVAIYGGVGKAPQLAALRRGPEIMVACPGRLLDHLSDGNIDLRQVEVLVLDEADTMCDMGFLPDVKRVLQRLPSRRQTLFFSATMPEEIRQLSQNILNSPVTVRINANAPAHTVAHALYPVPEVLKRKLLLALLQQTATGKVLIFTRTKHRARTLARELEAHNFRVTQLQGNLSQNRRQSAMDGFREGKYDFLVATDIAAHGIDVAEVSHVINFDMPDTVDAYTHRIGRTGRALQTGEAFTLATPNDAAIVRAVERAMSTRIDRRTLAGFDYGGFSPEGQFSQQTSRQARPPQHQRKDVRPEFPARRSDRTGRPEDRPPQPRDPQEGSVNTTTRRRPGRPATAASNAGPGRSGGRPAAPSSNGGSSRSGVPPSTAASNAGPNLSGGRPATAASNAGPGRSGGRPAAPSNNGGSNLGKSSSHQSTPSKNSSGNHTPGGARGNRHPRGRRFSALGRSSS